MMSKLVRGSIVALAAFAALAAVPAHAGTAPALVGSATQVHDSIQLTQRFGQGQSGAAWQTEAVSLTKSFQVRFSFSLHGGTFPQADGIAFVIQTDGPAALGNLGGGGGLGFDGLHGVGSVIQTYTNNRLGLAVDGDPYNAKAAPGDLGDSSSITGTEVVAYDAVNHVLSMQGRISVDGTSYDVSDSAAVDLQSLLGTDTATIGFTGATGDNTSSQVISKVNFKYTN